MKFRSIKYYLSEAFKSVLRNRLMSFTSIMTVAACIFIVVFMYCIMDNISYVMTQLEGTSGIVVFVDDDLTETEVSSMQSSILAIEHVEDAEYVSESAALDSFSDMLGDDTGLIEGLENDNPLPRSFNISLDSVRNQDEVIAQLNNMNGISSISHSKETTNALISLNNVVRIAGIIIIAILGICAVVIIMNTVKLTVNNRKNEIRIMKYVGATDWFIRWPFIIEGILIGMIGALIPVCICAAGYSGVIETIFDSLTFLKTLVDLRTTADIFPKLVPVAILLGAFIGVTGSLTSMRRYLDV